MYVPHVCKYHMHVRTTCMYVLYVYARTTCMHVPCLCMINIISYALPIILLRTRSIAILFVNERINIIIRLIWFIVKCISL